MPLLSVLLVLIVIGVVLWLVNTYIPMAPPIKTVINVLVVLVLCLWAAIAVWDWGCLRGASGEVSVAGPRP